MSVGVNEPILAVINNLMMSQVVAQVYHVFLITERDLYRYLLQIVHDRVHHVGHWL